MLKTLSFFPSCILCDLLPNVWNVLWTFLVWGSILTSNFSYNSWSRQLDLWCIYSCWFLTYFCPRITTKNCIFNWRRVGLAFWTANFAFFIIFIFFICVARFFRICLCALEWKNIPPLVFHLSALRRARCRPRNLSLPRWTQRSPRYRLLMGGIRPGDI